MQPLQSSKPKSYIIKKDYRYLCADAAGNAAFSNEIKGALTFTREAAHAAISELQTRGHKSLSKLTVKDRHVKRNSNV